MSRLFLILLLLLSGCSIHGKSSDPSIIVHPDRKGSVFDSVRWSPDGKQISFIRDGTLFVRDMQTGTNKKLVSKSLVLRSIWLNSSLILYYVNDGSASLKGTINKVDVNTGKVSLVAKDADSIQTINLFQNTVYLGEDKKGIRTLNLNELSNVHPNQVAISLENGSDFKISPVGDKIAFLDWTNRDSITYAKKAFLSLYDLEKKEINQVDQLKNYKVYNYCWSPDGKYIAFAGQSQEDKVPNLYVVNMGSHGQPLLFLPSINAADLDWSPTKSQLIVEKVGQPGQNDIRLFNIPPELLQ